MKLRDFIKHKKIRISVAAKALGVPPQTIGYWISGLRVPRKEYMQKIYHWSKGQVQPNDFYELSSADLVGDLPLFLNGNGHGANAHG